MISVKTLFNEIRNYFDAQTGARHSRVQFDSKELVDTPDGKKPKFTVVVTVNGDQAKELQRLGALIVNLTPVSADPSVTAPPYSLPSGVALAAPVTADELPPIPATQPMVVDATGTVETPEPKAPLGPEAIPNENTPPDQADHTEGTTSESGADTPDETPPELTAEELAAKEAAVHAAANQAAEAEALALAQAKAAQ